VNAQYEERLQNVMAGPRLVLGLSKSDARERAETLLKRVGLAERSSAFPSELSGGQQQRVAIARSLAMEPSLMLFDEPTSALDPEMVGEVLEVIRELVVSGLTMVIVTHEMWFARDVADQIVLMDAGRIVEQGTPEDVFMRSENARTREFLTRVER
jgi:polar amino acid transport system ATP-binding protein